MIVEGPRSTVSKGIRVGLINSKTPTNVGAVLRAAGCFGVEKVLYTGSRYARAARFSTDTQYVKSQVEFLAVDSLEDHVEDDVKIVCVELALGAIALLLPTFLSS